MARKAARKEVMEVRPDECQIRWLIRRDMDEICSIERRSFDQPWSEEEFLTCLRQRNCIGTVIELGQRVYGFMVYELHGNKLVLLNLAVDPEYRRTGRGGRMVQRLIDKLSQQRRRDIECEIRDSNLAAQLFFQRLGFRAVRVLRNRFPEDREDAYLFRYRLAGEVVGTCDT